MVKSFLKMSMFLVVIVFLILFLWPLTSFAGESEIENRLENLRKTTRWIESYKVDEWDCSNMSGYLSKVVFSDYSTIIVEGVINEYYFINTPTGREVRRKTYAHTMLRIWDGNKWRSIESTTLKFSPEPYWSDEREFKSYDEAKRCSFSLRGIDEYGIPIDYLTSSVFVPKITAPSQP